MKKLIILIFIGVIAFTTIIFSCKKDNESDKPNTPPVYTDGQGVIDNIGGTITIEDESSLLYGTTIVIPQNALDSSTEIKIVDATGEIIMPGDSSAYIIKLEPAGLEFSEPVSIEFPVQNNVNVSKLQAWNIKQVEQEIYQLPASYDSKKNKLIATTSHFSYFAISENGVHTTANMKYFNTNKTLIVNFSVNSWSFGNYYVLGGIPSKVWSWPFGIFNAKQIIDEGDPLTGSWVLTYLNLKVKKKNNFWFDPTIKEKRVVVKRIGDIGDGYGASVYEENLLDGNFKYGSSIMNSDIRESFFSGEAIVFSFPNTELDDDSKYYIEAKWGIVGSPDASIIGGRYTDLYTINSIGYAKKPSEMDDAGFRDHNNNFVDEAYEEIVPNDPPVASFVASTTSGTLPFSVQFIDQSSNNPTIWHWEFGDGFTSTEKNPIHTYNTAGTYSVKLTAQNTFGSDTEIKDNYIQVNQSGSAPIAEFTVTTTSGTVPLTVNFFDQSNNTPTSWQWNFGDGESSTSQNPNHTYISDGSYTVSLSVTNEYGSDSETKSNYIVVSSAGSPPVADFTANLTSGDAPLSVTFNDLSSNDPISWEWDFGDGGSSTNQNPSHTYNSDGSYTVSLIITNEFGSDSETKSNYIDVSSGGGGPDPDGYFTDTRDGQEYAFKIIGSQIWMYENLNFQTGSSWCYNNDPANCEIYGRLYDWETIMNGESSSNSVPSGVQGICPDGWHLPSDEEWKILEMYLGMSQSQADAIGWRGDDEGFKLKSIEWWNSNGNGNNFSGYTGKPGGWSNSNGNYSGIGNYGYWWSSTETNNSEAWNHGLSYINNGVERNFDGKNGSISVRCLKN